MKKITLLTLLITGSLWAQHQHNNPNPGYWQQHADYTMEVAMDVKTYQYTGTQEVVYTNNSPDTLRHVYYHLYNNAFQPGSEMDARLTSIADPDKRMVKSFKRGTETITESRISTLKPNEIGYLKINNLKQDGTAARNTVAGTVLEVILPKPILPGASTTFTLDFEGQVPLQVRRSGRNSSEDVALSMTQWYPKMAEYDFEGWHADPYIGREFHGVWSNFDVKITIDKEYTIGGTGYLQNKNEIGKGYQDEGIKVKHPRKVKTLTWHFVAPMVHDFAWGADDDYIHDKVVADNGTELHFFYKDNKEYNENWKKMQPKTVELLNYFNTNIGVYPYKQYSVVQGGDGGMEYAMCTLITGNRSYGSLVGVTAHEFAHSWFQHVLATNEAKHEWMDEGFTSYISDLAMEAVMPSKEENANPLAGAYSNYFYMAASGKEQPLSTHADRYDQNVLYGISAYSKGEIFLAQLGYLIGEDKLKETIKRFYTDYKFSHPTPNDIKRTAERVSGAHLDWYLTDWTQTTNTIDYGIKEVKANGNTTTITLERIGRMPMPLDIIVAYEDGSQESFYIPLQMMRYEKDNPYPKLKRTVKADWSWAHPTYEFTINRPKSAIKVMAIDPTETMADVNKENNLYTPQNN
ncbi:M1 family metallopeptidase [Flavobacterium litorale]|uniref:M1 family metallopeptidase n=1 Tax=Flavobacterium litorale TaxID=2856519 RepID=A0ABX8VDU4_9FLAO|nr:M1 family metallopeptidase [Flavobacterium litorale]QYJ69010.1 M1 family metallopeptidase [Flavobacterium litorale]